MVVADELEPAAVWVGDIEPLGPLCVLNRSALKRPEIPCTPQNVLKASRIDIERELVGIPIAVVTLRCKEDQQRVADPDWIVGSLERLATGQIDVEAPQRDRVVRPKRDVVDPQDTHRTMKARASSTGHHYHDPARAWFLDLHPLAGSDRPVLEANIEDVEGHTRISAALGSGGLSLHASNALLVATLQVGLPSAASDAILVAVNERANRPPGARIERNMRRSRHTV